MACANFSFFFFLTRPQISRTNYWNKSDADDTSAAIVIICLTFKRKRNRRLWMKEWLKEMSYFTSKLSPLDSRVLDKYCHIRLNRSPSVCITNVDLDRFASNRFVTTQSMLGTHLVPWYPPKGGGGFRV